ncbi:pentatricopeptide repeat-containing protein At4g39952, mitochondrial [Amborella trichopoda]|uniref:pentatricopeptide repeat-containing protein At4g39952, mitochondrial n=1 Tax=Amborella trichopoda TaxID=13333 RepID=UPI0009BD6604|nr:pentatricopeptide repeat-containing protein At4g39952, mitochondrial [Amborella trichopoda]XP_020520310.1 pentatricopeptide repeat-containing protein At4g39952, mitochondrial [Amborella trichopoda]|eukprot:XP_020520304.1 pentatricopeptide repeat-containing protein At4g39952, mitochondrial [Amborella trichopoda]
MCKTTIIIETLCHFLSHPAPTLATLAQAHTHVLTLGLSHHPAFVAKLVTLYARLNLPSCAARAFDAVPSHQADTFLWNALIQSQASNNLPYLSLCTYMRMRRSCVEPDGFTYPLILSACAKAHVPWLGLCAHATALRLGLVGLDPAIGSGLMYMYAKFGFLGLARQVFDEMSERDEVSWTTLIVGYVQNKHFELGLGCLKAMVIEGGVEKRPGYRAIEVGFQASASLGEAMVGSCIHGFSIKLGIGCASSVLGLYCKCGWLREGYVAFMELEERDLISWTEIIALYARIGFGFKCLELFNGLLSSALSPDGVVIGCALMGSVKTGVLNQGKCVHGLVLRRGFLFSEFEFNNQVNTSLLSMYCKFGHLDLSRKVFDALPQRVAESWSAIIVGLFEHGQCLKCLEFFRNMKLGGFCTDSNCLVAVISSCSQLGALCFGKSVHCYIIKTLTECEASVSVDNSLIAMYSECGDLGTAHVIFDKTQRDIISWNTMIAAHVHSGKASEALSLFKQMREEKIELDSVTLVSVLPACSQLATLEEGIWIHNYINNSGIEINIPLGTALVDMYAKCGELESSKEVFYNMPQRDVISWNAMISGYAMHGKAMDAFEVFVQMLKSGTKPNDVTFLGVLEACSHGGLVKFGKKLFVTMKAYSVVPTLKHYACMVDLLGRAGNLDEANELINAMPMAPDHGIWGALLGACKIHGEIELGEQVAEHLFQLDPNNDGYYILLSNIYASAKRWRDAQRVRDLMVERGVRKKPGWSSVEVEGGFNVFLVGDSSHPAYEEMCFILKGLLSPMEELGYVPSTVYEP